MKRYFSTFLLAIGAALALLSPPTLAVEHVQPSAQSILNADTPPIIAPQKCSDGDHIFICHPHTKPDAAPSKSEQVAPMLCNCTPPGGYCGCIGPGCRGCMRPDAPKQELIRGTLLPQT